MGGVQQLRRRRRGLGQAAGAGGEGAFGLGSYRGWGNVVVRIFRAFLTPDKGATEMLLLLLRTGPHWPTGGGQRGLQHEYRRVLATRAGAGSCQENEGWGTR